MDAPDRNVHQPAKRRSSAKERRFRSKLKAFRKKHKQALASLIENWQVPLEKAESDTSGNWWFKKGEPAEALLDRFNWEKALKKYLSFSPKDKHEIDTLYYKRVFCASIAGLAGIKIKNFGNPSKKLEKKVFEVLANHKDAYRKQKEQRFDFGSQRFVIMPGDGYVYAIFPRCINTSDFSREKIETQYIQEKAPAEVVYEDDNIMIIKTPEYHISIEFEEIEIARFKKKPNVAFIKLDESTFFWLIYNPQTNKYFRVSDIDFGRNSKKDWEDKTWIFDGVYREVTAQNFAENPDLAAGKLEIDRKMAATTKIPAQD